MILEEFDDSRKAILNPEDIVKEIEGFPKVRDGKKHSRKING